MKKFLLEISEEVAKGLIDCIDVAECEYQATDKDHEFKRKLIEAFDIEYDFDD